MSSNRGPQQEFGADEFENTSFDAGSFGLGLSDIPSSLDFPSTEDTSSYYRHPSDAAVSNRRQHEKSEAMSLRVTQFTPQEGVCGDVVSLTIRSDHDLSQTQGGLVQIFFSGRQCPVSIQPVPTTQAMALANQYTISFRVPTIQLGNTPRTLECPLELHVRQGSRGVAIMPFGNFALHATSSQGQSSTNPIMPSEVSAYQGSPIDTNLLSVRRASTQSNAHDSVARSRSSSYTQPLLYQAINPPSSTSYGNARRNQTFGPIQNTSPFEQPRRSSSLPSSQRAESEGYSQPPGRGFSYPSDSEQGSREQSASYARTSPSAPGQSGSTNPPLVRTSTLNSQSSSGATGSFSASPGPSRDFNPYSMSPSKAVLKLDGELEDMAIDWSEEEKSAKRRLIEFKRSQNGNTITASFKPVTLEQRAPNSICVSCIWWEDKEECFVTSVDTIQLLEALVAVRFTVEEKNRIRRNLEGFRPLTVAKGKSDSEGFFKTIMDFPNPKPRNIEKDVKVFSWKVLTSALKKIIGKYSASYASTASSLHPSSAFEGTSGGGPSEYSRYSASPMSHSSTGRAATPMTSSQSAFLNTASSMEAGPTYGRHTSYAPMQGTPMPAPQAPQYASYAPIGYGWSGQEQDASGYGQPQQIPHFGTWTPQYNFDGSPMVASAPQFGPAQQQQYQPPVSLPLQQRQYSQSQQPYTGYGHSTSQP